MNIWGSSSSNWWRTWTVLLSHASLVSSRRSHAPNLCTETSWSLQNLQHGQPQVRWGIQIVSPLSQCYGFIIIILTILKSLTYNFLFIVLIFILLLLIIIKTILYTYYIIIYFIIYFCNIKYIIIYFNNVNNYIPTFFVLLKCL